MSQRLFVLLTALVVGLSWMGGRASAVVVVPAPAQSGWTTITKATDETRASNTTLTDDSTLLFSMAASTKYRIRGRIWYTTAATPDFKWGISSPSSPTLYYTSMAENAPAGAPNFPNLQADGTNMASRSITAASGTAGTVWWETCFQNGSNAASYKVQWAQDTSNASSTTVNAGSYLEYKVAQ